MPVLDLRVCGDLKEALQGFPHAKTLEIKVDGAPIDTTSFVTTFTSDSAKATVDIATH